mmetsp:Transcript_14199/g.21444  ORF Transcript_14199/g.21444 Transcript_14199/m.21444 type:complete len:612 (+) Transcript_14199:131-1966(+)|eukprot:CAMPEP_0202728298 /NCGR_PEP_ID=MMETSP1385-20130828/185555_1 /ASSEMBLY_ACC=CAM_ASM_000861 /TAXON_ID=933848 /ORGANISM="Elphidium margaritaceum" /LENGTH=611 /DNA_ID=CAMNT_0049394545 /DNA_START=130 /DNA_END=1965 /DNA_ORIENTATION=-
MRLDCVCLAVYALLSLQAVLCQGGCCYNTDCSYTYSDDVENCFMESVYSSNTGEGFCWGGDCLTISCTNSWDPTSCSQNEGTCKMKKGVGESCQNADGNYDNNNCVTGLCSDTSGVCEMRTNGCSSFANCVEIGAKVALNLVEYVGQVSGVETFSTSSCSQGGSVCRGNGEFTPQENGFTISYYHTFADILTLIGTFSLEQPDDTITIDADFASPDVAVYLSETNVTLDLEAFVDLQSGASGSVELLLSDGRYRCYDPLNKKYECEPYIIYEKTIALGSSGMTVNIEIGAQVVGEVSYEVSGDSGVRLNWAVRKSWTIPKLGAGITASELYLLGTDLSSLWDASPVMTPVDIIVEEGSVDVEATLSLGPQFYIDINGIKLYGGVDFVFKTAAELVATAGSGCASGGAAVSFGAVMHFYSPPFSLSTGVEALCQTIFGHVQEVINTVQDVTENAYGTHCQVYMDPCDSDFDLCGLAASAILDEMSGIRYASVATSAIEVSEVLFSASLSQAFTVNGATCSGSLTDSIEEGGDHAYNDNSCYCGCSTYRTTESSTGDVVYSNYNQTIRNNSDFHDDFCTGSCGVGGTSEAVSLIGSASLAFLLSSIFSCIYIY